MFSCIIFIAIAMLCKETGITAVVKNNFSFSKYENVLLIMYIYIYIIVLIFFLGNLLCI